MPEEKCAPSENAGCEDRDVPTDVALGRDMRVLQEQAREAILQHQSAANALENVVKAYDYHRQELDRWRRIARGASGALNGLSDRDLRSWSASAGDEKCAPC